MTTNFPQEEDNDVKVVPTLGRILKELKRTASREMSGKAGGREGGLCICQKNTDPKA